MKTTQHILLAIAAGALVGAARWIFECLVVVPMVPDPQSGIWVMISTVTSVLIALTIFPCAWIALRGIQSHSALNRVVSLLPLIALLGWYSLGFIHLAKMRSALRDSADPHTSPNRLRELANFSGGPGYEIDNRIAKNPNSPPDVLRSLHGRPDQTGTEMCLAMNPHTPDDVLLELSNRNDEWSKSILDALKRNPRYDELITNKGDTLPE
ncbi:MAG: hypothetical protein ACTHK7_15185 [Aureliella sp.]